MGLIPQVKCGRCDRTYSGLRSRCPYCGAHRSKKGKRATDGDNATWKMIIGLLLIVVLIAAVIVIVVTSLGEKNNPTKPNDGDGDITHGDGALNIEGQNPQNPGDDTENPGGDTPDDPNNPTGTDDPDSPDNPDDPNAPATPDTPDTPETPATPDNVIAQSLKVNSKYQKPATDFTLKLNESVECTAVITPSNVTSVPVWSSSDESVIAVVPEDETGLKATLTGMGKGRVTITCTVDAITYEFTVYGSGKK